MELVLLAVTLSSLILNALVYKRIKATAAMVVFEYEATSEPVEQETVIQEDPPPLVTTPMVQEVYQGWRNQSKISWTDTASPPAPNTRPPQPGPLERPGGFI